MTTTQHKDSGIFKGIRGTLLFKQSSLLQSAYIAIFLIFTPLHTTLMAQPDDPATVIIGDKGDDSIDRHQGVRIVLAHDEYCAGDKVAYTIVNASAETIFYTFGCNVPLIYRINGSDNTALTIDIYESIPDLNVLGAGEEQTCHWNQQAWQDMSREGRARFQHYKALAPVPAGQYQFGLDYYLDEADIDYSDKAQTAFSNVFIISPTPANRMQPADPDTK